MKLEEGMYVRTSKGKIRKFESNNSMARVPFMIKCSYNIIDLIELGDFVNGYKIDYINLNCETPFLRSNQPYRVDNTLYSTLIEKGKDYNQPLHFYEEDIKTILTKEQYENNCYKVEE